MQLHRVVCCPWSVPGLLGFFPHTRDIRDTYREAVWPQNRHFSLPHLCPPEDILGASVILPTLLRK